MRGGEDRCLFICLLITEVLKGGAVPCWREGDGGGVHRKRESIQFFFQMCFLLNVSLSSLCLLKNC